MHKKCFTVAKSRFVRSSSGDTKVDKRFSKDITALTSFNHVRQTVIDTADIEVQKTNDHGLDAVLKTELS
jgi:hypothetical protein